MSRKAATVMTLDAPMSNPVRSVADTGSTGMERGQTLVPLSFKVTKSFKKRYQQAALNADMKLNELLSAMLDHWESTGQAKQ